VSQPIEETNGDITQGQPVVEDNQNDTGTSNEDTTTGGHPAWKEILDQLPDEFHPLITPKLEAWDAGVQTRFQSLQSQYEPFKQFVEQEVDPAFIEQAIGLAAAIEQDPERVYKALAEAYGYGQGAEVTPETLTTDEDDETDPIATRLAEHERMMEEMASTFLADQNAKEQQEFDAALTEYMSALHEAYDPTGGFDDNFVLTQLSQGVDGEVAVKNFQETVKKFAGGNTSVQAQDTSGNGAPPVLGAGGGLPSQQVDISKLSDADAQKLVTEMLRTANES
jgi:hypothetical protein